VSEEPLWLMGTPGGVTPNQGKAHDLQLTMFRSSADRMKAYEAGALDCETGSPLNLIFAASSGLTDFTDVATISEQHPGGVVTSYLVRDDIKTPADLKGKIIARRRSRWQRSKRSIRSRSSSRCSCRVYCRTLSRPCGSGSTSRSS
jgi:hypothetical protein